ncbi:hypothetical protein GJR96_17325 [Haloferax sp. MBLA0076]|uniref:ParB/Sulfiredoxin domain-containing protein n=1 Tax=Haloferax litoreum TaxID=2666140 RepID=A0A6A8GK90_9EURY|nr:MULTISPECIES: hypothetical protein [Haloferax]KAB1189938.1 hypothetical protein Hfx1148_17260 [Haloferax sp. CBA1148]MRX23708.1 hypothetical protein [Haloferax litoreum]
MLRSAGTIYREWGLRYLIAIGTEHFLIRALADSRSPSYWRRTESFHDRILDTDVSHYEHPTNPFALRYVDPAKISRFSGRGSALWENAMYEIGTVQDGDWDIEPYRGPLEDKELEITFANALEETVLYRSMKEHFTNGVAWEDTQFVQRMCELIEESDTRAWHGSLTCEDVRERCAYLDSLYERIQTDGFLSQRELQQRGEEPPKDYLDTLRSEILVDIGRDGEFLMVDGRHRLSIAKILGVESIPVVVVVRHTQWMDKINSDPEVFGSHPDLSAEKDTPTRY